MQRSPVSPAMGRWIISLLLVALCVRALVPVGFMPATDRPFSFQICPDGFPAELLSRAPAPTGHEHHHDHHAATEPADDDSAGGHQHGAVRAEHCVFAAVASAGPAPDVLLLGSAPAAQAPPIAQAVLPVFAVQRFHRPQSRAPPTLS